MKATKYQRVCRLMAGAGVFSLIAPTAPSAIASQAAIVVDGLYEDWAGVSLAYQDASSDGGGTGIDFGRIWIVDDDEFVVLRLEMGTEADLSENNVLRLYLDTDMNAATGTVVAGIGAELEWWFGGKTGTFFDAAGNSTVRQDDIRIRSAPTITSTEFEFAIGRDVLPDGINPLFSGSQFRLVIVDQGGDQLPNSGDTITYTFDVGQAPPASIIPLERQLPVDIRLITHNVLNDSPFFAALEPLFGRQLAAVVPDILNFQEIRNHSAAETAAFVDTYVAPNPGDIWYAADNNDCITVSRYPIVDSWPLDGNLAVLIDTTAALGSQMLIVNAHLPCCTNENGRQAEADRIMGFIRDARDPGGVLTLAADSPIVITGDLNLVGFAQQLTTLLTGDIVTNIAFGPDFDPDWDGTGLTNLVSRHADQRFAYTWRNDNSTFWPGHLDFVIYSDSVLTQGNAFILDTREMSPARLASHSLQAGDSGASDHIMVCTDFRRTTLFGDSDFDGDVDLDDYAPFADCLAGPSTSPTPALPLTSEQCLILFDSDGDDDVDLDDFEAFAESFTG